MVFAHPAPYKVNLYNSLTNHVNLTVVFQRYFDRYSRLQYLHAPVFKFKHLWLKGLPLGQYNHLSFSLIKHLKKTNYNHIIMNGYSTLTEILTIFYLQRKRIPYYLAINGGVIRRDSWWLKHLKKQLISKAMGYLSPSVKADDYLVHYGAKRDRILHYPYSTLFASEVLKAPLSPEAKQALRKQLNLPLDGKLSLSIGQFIPRKNFTALLHAWRNVDKTNRLIIIGDGPLRKRYEGIIKRYHMTHVQLLPFQPKPRLLQMLSASDGFILLSKEDIYGHVINEALSQGIPVLASSQIISAQTLIEPGQQGYLLPLNQITMLPHYLTKLFALDSGFSCIEVASRHTIETMTKAHLEIFNQMNLSNE
jgi:L-malate glycosyltransferase